MFWIPLIDESSSNLFGSDKNTTHSTTMNSLLKNFSIPLVLSLSLLLTLGNLSTLHSADRSQSPPTNTPSRQDRLQREQADRALQLLQEEYEKQDQLVREQQRKVDELNAQLGVVNVEGVSSAAGAEPLRRLESLRIEGQAEFERLNSLYAQLTNLTRTELKRTVSTAAPDTLLSSLLEQQTTNEQKLAELSDSFGPEHPDVRRVRRVLEKIAQQIDDRLEGILLGLKTKTMAEKAKIESLQREMESAAKSEIEFSIKRSPYLQAQRDLDNFKLIRDRLLARMIQEKVEAIVSRAGQEQKRKLY